MRNHWQIISAIRLASQTSFVDFIALFLSAYIDIAYTISQSLRTYRAKSTSATLARPQGPNQYSHCWQPRNPRPGELWNPPRGPRSSRAPVLSTPPLNSSPQRPASSFVKARLRQDTPPAQTNSLERPRIKTKTVFCLQCQRRPSKCNLGQLCSTCIKTDTKCEYAGRALAEDTSPVQDDQPERPKIRTKTVFCLQCQRRPSKGNLGQPWSMCIRLDTDCEYTGPTLASTPRREEEKEMQSQRAQSDFREGR